MREGYLDQLIMEYRSQSTTQTPNSSNLLKMLQSKIDTLIYKDETEYLERSDLPFDLKIDLVDRLSLVNRRSGYNKILIHRLEKLLTAIADSICGRPVRILEIGSGGGGFLEAIYEWSKKKSHPVELSGMDLAPEFALHTQAKLHKKGIPVRMLQGNACDCPHIQDQSYDIVISNYMVHHIRSATDVARFLAEVYRITAHAWMIIDFDRRWSAPGFAALGAFFGASAELVGDGIKSARRAYRAEEINLILEGIKPYYALSEMTCKRMPLVPYWVIAGHKKL